MQTTTAEGSFAASDPVKTFIGQTHHCSLVSGREVGRALTALAAGETHPQLDPEVESGFPTWNVIAASIRG